jgi:hypothetical protein
VADEEFVRPYHVERADPGERRKTLLRGEWQRRRGEERRPLEVQLPQEVLASHLRLVVTDYRNPSLTLTGARYTAPVRQVIFAPPPDLQAPLRLYFGNPTAEAPHYDFAATLPARPEPTPARAMLDTITRNPLYNPPPKPLTERWPWLVDLVLGLASLVLLAILVALGREAVRQHDTTRHITGNPNPSQGETA